MFQKVSFWPADDISDRSFPTEERRGHRTFCTQSMFEELNTIRLVAEVVEHLPATLCLSTHFRFESVIAPFHDTHSEIGSCIMCVAIICNRGNFGHEIACFTRLSQRSQAMSSIKVWSSIWTGFVEVGSFLLGIKRFFFTLKINSCRRETIFLDRSYLTQSQSAN